MKLDAQQKNTLMANEIGAEPSAPRVPKRQRHRQNAESDSPQQYYLSNVAIPFMDHLCVELDSQFSEHSKPAVKLLNMVPSVLRTKDGKFSDIKELCEFYESDLHNHGVVEQEFNGKNGSGNPQKQNIFLRIVPTH